MRKIEADTIILLYMQNEFVEYRYIDYIIFSSFAYFFFFHESSTTDWAVINSRRTP